MPTITLVRQPANKHSIHAGDYELWINDSLFQTLPNNSEAVTIHLEAGTYKLELRKRLWLRSPIFTAELLSDDSTIKLITGSAVTRGESFSAGMLGVATYNLLRTIPWFQDENHLCSCMVILFALAAIQWRFSKQILLKLAEPESQP
jgi:hypothetical protein